MGTWWVVTNNACMGHSDRVNKRVHETGGMRWAGRDTMDETGTHQQSSHVLTRIARTVIPGNLSDVHFGLHHHHHHREPVFRVLISPKTHAMKNVTSIVAYSHHRFHDFGGRALVTRMSFSPNSLSMLCKVQSVAWFFKPDS